MDTRRIPAVDVVMIAYNKASTIDEAIRGVVKQKGCFKLRLIVMDDCSTDSTGAIAQEWQRRHPDIVDYHRNEHNLGLQGNYLAAFALCSADYVAICDADDYWISRKKIARQTAYMESHPNCMITFHRVVNLYESSGEMSLSNGGQKSDTGIEDLARGNYITNLSVMYRTGKVDLKKLPDWIRTDRSPDYAFHMLHAAHGSIHYFSRPMGVYRQAAGSAWSMTEQYERLRMSLTVRLNLLTEFTGIHEVEKGLLAATGSILNAMSGCADSEQRKQFVADKARQLNITLSQESATQPGHRRLVSRIRGALSKLIPTPRA
ncbi:MAG: glycosyltransferase [Bacteroides sp.]|nr:glycosyltransferase [Bacteroides sp.]MCM1413928.1 glycosyltransferase [Bacteroides sp.]MCM1471645.1 glycosyltransferase [Bacteroides sp.]